MKRSRSRPSHQDLFAAASEVSSSAFFPLLFFFRLFITWEIGSSGDSPCLVLNLRKRAHSFDSQCDDPSEVSVPSSCFLLDSA